MKQQINLYQPMLKKQKVVFSAVTMLQVGVFFLVMFSGIYFYQLSQISPYSMQLGKIDNEINQLATQIAQLKAKQNKGKSKLLENEIQKLTEQLNKRERISSILSSRNFGNANGFSALLESFARGHVSGTWLTDISISQGGAALGLKGKTLSSELVPLYIQQLADEESLDGSSFNTMEIARVETEDAESQINFYISTN